MEALLRRAAPERVALDRLRFGDVEVDFRSLQAWGYTHFPLTRTVYMHVAKLRHKLGDDPANARYILTVHRVGYRFVG